MTYLLWQREGQARIASTRVVLRAAEVPRLSDAIAVRGALERLYSEAEARVDAAAASARAAAHDEGLAEGRQRADEECARRLDALVRAATLDRERLRNSVGALALQVVRKMLGQFAPDDLLLALADRAAVDLLPDAPSALVVHPDRLDAVRERIARAGPDSALADCQLRADPLCAPDACRLETAFGSVDAALEAQLVRLESAWTEHAR